jgi:hypothetical protein
MIEKPKSHKLQFLNFYQHQLQVWQQKTENFNFQA